MNRRRARGLSGVECGWLALLAVILNVAAAESQQEPHLTGRTEIGLSAGTITGDVCLENLTPRGDSVTIALNSAFTISRVSGAYADPVARETEPGGTGTRYTFAGVLAPANGASAGSGSEAIICLEYSGRFPVHDIAAGNFREDDASSVVAFTGSHVRARGVSRWHPTLHDPETGVTAEAVSWRLEVVCPECTRVYLNGELAIGGEPFEFVSSESRELLMLAGDLSVTRAGGMKFIGAPVATDTAEAFAGILADVSGFLEAYTGVPFGPPPDVLTIAPARAPRRGNLWGFLGDPALALIGMSIPELLTAVERPGAPSRRQVLGFLAHELAHRYFAWRLGGGTAQRDLFGEPFAVYLELKAVRHYFGEAEYLQGLARLRDQAARIEGPATLLAATADDFADSGYRYGYAPLALFSLEAAIGEPAMREALRSMLESPAPERYTADFTFLMRSAIRAGVAEEVLTAWMERCLAGDPFEQDCLPDVDGMVADGKSGFESQSGIEREYASTSSAPDG